MDENSGADCPKNTYDFVLCILQSELAALEDEKSTVRQSVSTSSNEQTPQPHTSPPCNISHATASSTPLRPGNGADVSGVDVGDGVETLTVTTITMHQ